VLTSESVKGTRAPFCGFEKGKFGNSAIGKRVVENQLKIGLSNALIRERKRFSIAQ
jgi:hypothetical protein